MLNTFLIITAISAVSLGGSVILPAELLLRAVPKADNSRKAKRYAFWGIFTLFVSAILTICSFHVFTEVNTFLVAMVVSIVTVLMLMLYGAFKSASKERQYFVKKSI